MELWAIIPELILLSLCLVLVPVAGWVKGSWRKLPAWAALIGLMVCMLSTIPMLSWEPISVFHGTYAVDGLAAVFKLLIEAGALITVIFLMSYFKGHSHIAHAPIALLFVTLGSVGLASSLDLALIVLFLQMMGMGSYVLIVLVREDRRALESSIKFFIFTATALAIMAYGLTFLYGLTGSLNLLEIAQQLDGTDHLWLALVLILVLVGYGLEITVVPFHFWAPDVFEGATAPVSGFLSVVPKTAAIAGLVRFLVQGLPSGSLNWPFLIAVIAAVTMTFGNLVALQQTGLKRLLAYSSIAQAGYILMAVAVATSSGVALPSAAYYLAVYLFMNVGAFAVIGHVERTLGSDQLHAVRGLGKRSPWPSAVLAISLLSLAGIPPLAGFLGKVLIFNAAYQGGMVWLAVIAAANMVLALSYYIRVVAEMYLRAPLLPHALPQDAGYTAVYVLCFSGTLALGITPRLFMEFTEWANRLCKMIE